MNIMSIEQAEDFIDYVLSFYGNEGIYDIGATRSSIIIATNNLLKRYSEEGLEFYGDSCDRERVRAILEINAI